MGGTLKMATATTAALPLRYTTPGTLMLVMIKLRCSKFEHVALVCPCGRWRENHIIGFSYAYKYPQTTAGGAIISV